MKTILPILRKTLSINTLIVVLCLVLYSIGVGATVRYVKPIASGMANGSSWANASDDIQAMINASAITDSVWVAAGEYKPNSFPPNCVGCENSRFYTFYVKDGIRLFGNFEGTETDITQRDFGINTTFLSGDLNDDDEVSGSFLDLTISGKDENVYHVILVSDTSSGNLPVTIDGFIIKGGNATADSSYFVNGIDVTKFQGGGIFIRNQLTSIANNFILNNSAITGGGIYSNAQNTIISNNIIASNKATNAGGGIATKSTISTISNNSIIGNSSFWDGGGTYCATSELYYINNEISGNASEYYGGGISISNGTNNIIKNTFSNNYARRKGGAIKSSYGTNTIKDNVIANNTVEIDGGGLHLLAGLNSVVNNVIYNNSAEMDGGGIYLTSSYDTITNNTIVNNISNGIGGGIFIDGWSNTFVNNILWNNKLLTEPNLVSADVFLNIFTNTFKNNIFQLDTTLYIGSNFIINVNAQGNLFAQNPEFLNINNPAGEDLFYLTDDDGLRLRESSPALNAGILTDAPATDILGVTRDLYPDIGAYENGVVVGIQPNIGSTSTATLHAYPNPATDAITFTFTTPITDISTLLLYAIDGQNITTLYKGTTQTGETNTLTIDTKAFTPGTYCAVLRCGNGLAQHRTIIIK